MKLEPIAGSVRRYGPAAAASHSASVAPGASVSGALETCSQRLKAPYVPFTELSRGTEQKSFSPLSEKCCISQASD